MDDNGKLASIAKTTRKLPEANATKPEPEVAQVAPEPEGKVEAAPRRKRVPVGRASARLYAPERKGYKRRWVNETPGRRETLKNAYYEQVSDPDIATESTGTVVCRTADRATGTKTYLMETREEYYEEDKKAKAAELALMDKSIREGSVQGTPGVDGRYVGDIRIESK